MKESLFLPLREEDLTTLRIDHDWKTGRVSVRSAREWDATVDWSRYGQEFSYEDVLLPDVQCYGSRETLELFEKHGLAGYLDAVVALIAEGRHQGIECFYNRQKDIRFTSNMHSNTLGIRNGFHAIRAGGIRRHDPGTEELEVVVDGLNLSRAMSFKNAAARIPFGGSKITVQSEPVDLDDLSAVGFLAHCLDRTRSVTGPDMGFSPRLADVMKERGYSPNIAGGFENNLGPTGGPTAYGVYLALKEAMEFRYGTPSLAGRTIVVQGLGAVGMPLVEEYLVQEKATILCAEVDPKPVSKLVNRFPERVKPVEPQEVLGLRADVLVPCAVGGILDEKAIRSLKYDVVLGAANNQLKATNPEEEMNLARLLQERGILFQVDWIHNAGGVIAGMEEYIRGEKASLEHVLAQTRQACMLGTRENLAAAKRLGITPTEMAYRHYSALIYR